MEEQNDTSQEEFNIEAVAKECLDAPGYAIFVAKLGKEKDEQGRMRVDFKYKRYQMSYEDTKKGIDEFIRMFREDVQSL